MGFVNMGFVNKKMSKANNEILIGILKLDRDIKAGTEFKVMINIGKPAKGGGFGVSLLTEDEEKAEEKGKKKLF